MYLVQRGIMQNAGLETALTSQATYTATIYLSRHESSIVALRECARVVRLGSPAWLFLQAAQAPRGRRVVDRLPPSDRARGAPQVGGCRKEGKAIPGNGH